MRDADIIATPCQLVLHTSPPTRPAHGSSALRFFYRHFDDLPSLAPELLPDADAPLVDRVTRLAPTRPQEVVAEMVDGLVAVFAEHGRLLRAIDDAARHDPAVAEHLESALAGPRRLIESLLRAAPSPPPRPEE